LANHNCLLHVVKNKTAKMQHNNLSKKSKYFFIPIFNHLDLLEGLLVDSSRCFQLLSYYFRTNDKEPGIIVHTSNPIYSEGGDRRYWF
jgi:hypothetical protein